MTENELEKISDDCDRLDESISEKCDEFISKLRGLLK